MELPEYYSLNIKSNFFEQVFIETIDVLDQYFPRLSMSPIANGANYIESIYSNKIYRGVGEAKYMLYSSAQRVWITNELYKLFNVSSDSSREYNSLIKRMISEARPGQTHLIL